MASRITLIKSYRNRETLRLLELQEVAELISQGEYDEAVSTFRRELPMMQYVEVGNNGTLEGYDNWPKDLPRICFALEQENRNHELVTRGYTGLVLLEVNNLTSYDEAEAVRRGAGEMPQTLMAFVGADGLSVKIVCRGELLEVRGQFFEEGGRRNEEGEYSKPQNTPPSDISSINYKQRRNFPLPREPLRAGQVDLQRPVGRHHRETRAADTAHLLHEQRPSACV